MYKLIFSSILVLAVITATAQKPKHICASNIYLNYLNQYYPGITNEVKALTQYQNYQKTRVGTVTIPVVFHVVYKNNTENLSDSYINAQMDLLNACYSRTNGDTSSMRSIYQSRVGPT